MLDDDIEVLEEESNESDGDEAELVGMAKDLKRELQKEMAVI